MKKTTQEQLDYLGDRLVVASISGGKDSLALALWLKENGVPHDRIFVDTGWEHPDTYAYLREVLTPALGPIQWLSSGETMPELIRRKGMFPGKFRFCTSELKMLPIISYYEGRLDAGEECVNAVGVRGQESLDRAKMEEWGWDFEQAETWRPLLSWSLDEVVATIRDAGIPPNPLYLRGASRVGCYPCVKANKEDLRHGLEPWRVSEIEQLEESVTAAANLRAAARGLSPVKSRTFFKGGPLAEVLAWAQTARGGHQLYLLDTDTDRSCMRWGVCE